MVKTNNWLVLDNRELLNLGNVLTVGIVQRSLMREVEKLRSDGLRYTAAESYVDYSVRAILTSGETYTIQSGYTDVATAEAGYDAIQAIIVS